MFILEEPRDTFILGISSAKNHFSIAPEGYYIARFEDDIKGSGYENSLKFIRFPYKKEVNYNFLKNILDFKIDDKFGYDKFFK